MKVIDAVWEKANLDVSCNEVIVEKEDTVESLQSQYDEVFGQKDYVVVKVGPNHFAIHEFLESHGFRFVEVSIGVKLLRKNFRIPELIKKASQSSCKWKIMDQKDIDTLFDKIKTGLFDTDRVYLDPYFSKELAARRYINWISTLIQKNVLPHKFLFKDKAVGFFIQESEGHEMNGILGGIYGDYKGMTGVGGLWLYATYSEAFAHEEIDIFRGHVSSNNLNVLKLHLLFGANVESMQYIFIKHN